MGMTTRDWILKNCKFANFDDLQNLQQNKRSQELPGPRDNVEEFVLNAMKSLGISDIKIHETHPNWATDTVFEGVLGEAAPYIVKILVDVNYTNQNSRIQIDPSKFYVHFSWDLFSKEGAPMNFGRNVEDEFRTLDNFEYRLDLAIRNIKRQIDGVKKRNSNEPFAGPMKTRTEQALESMQWTPEDLSDAAQMFQ